MDLVPVRFCLGALLCLELLGCGLGDAPLEEVDPEAIPPVVTWEDHVAPLMDRYCTGCHSAEIVSGAAEGLDYSRLDYTRCTFEEVAEVALEEGSMPPGGARRLDGLDKAMLRRWSAQGYPRALRPDGSALLEPVDCRLVEDGDSDDDADEGDDD